MKVNSDEAVDFFNTRGYLVINSSRASGKTTTLKRIIEENPNLKIGVKTPTRRIFNMYYKKYENCTSIITELDSCGYRFDILIGDEVHIEPVIGQKTACAYTMKYIELSLDSVHINLDKLKHSKWPEQFETEFGQYLE
ncbi:hypothetical protein GQ473_04380 [archaeon]|nr:hypothetical protein [archaeon]